MISQFVLFFSLLSCCIQMVGADSLSNTLFPTVKQAIDDDNIEFFKTLDIDSVSLLAQYLQTQKKIALEEYARFMSIPMYRGLKPCNEPTSVENEGAYTEQVLILDQPAYAQQAFFEHYLSRLNQVLQQKKQQQEQKALRAFIADPDQRRNTGFASTMSQLLGLSEE